ncbi:unnamed protein product [Rhizoctonia solani]|uniref:Uncharacterized protein n=1 Tax=Rhizoctonia solani TaxID=456999 RepID=A0A8H3GLF4_9AGAM|nr:unnamed protein product [Rhizoctonia solani]
MPKVAEKKLNTYANEWASDPMFFKAITNLGTFLSGLTQPEDRTELEVTPGETFAKVVHFYVALGSTGDKDLKSAVFMKPRPPEPPELTHHYTTMTDHRSIYILIFHSRIFPAHWALWIPSPSQSKIGKIINAVGDPSSGFVREIERQFNLANASGAISTVLLSNRVEAKHILDSDSSGPEPVDEVEKIASGISPPEKSLNSAQNSKLPVRRVEIKNCQTWLREFVCALVEHGICEAEAIDVLDRAPRN